MTAFLDGRVLLHRSPLFLCFSRVLAWLFLPVRYAPARYASPVFPSGAFGRGTAARAGLSSGVLSRLRVHPPRTAPRGREEHGEAEGGMIPRSACAA